MKAASSTDASYGTGLTLSSPASAGSELIVTYEYAIVPEPSTGLLFGLGVGGLVLVWRRRSTRQTV
jgi:hypothetical protein